MFIYLLMCIHFIYIAAEDYNGSTFDESQSNSQHIWHSYVFNTGVGNREELHFSNVELNSDFESFGGIFKWKSLQTEAQNVIVGLGHDFLRITTISNKSDLSTYQHEIQGPAKTHAVFQKWDVKTQKMESFIIVARCSTKEGCTLMWYKLLRGRLEFLWDWQYLGNITHLDVVKINYESKLLVVNEKSTIHKNPSAEIYSFHVNDELDIWLFEKLILTGSPSSVAVLDSIDNVFFCVSFPHLETVQIFKYSKSLCVDALEKKHFVSHQKIFSIGLKSVTPFQVGFHWHLAVASRSSLIYYIGDNLMFQPVSSLPLGNFNNWLAVPVDNYREDIVLLADSGSDVSAVAWTGDKDIKVIGSFTRLACGDDALCSEKMKRVSLNESTAFTRNGRQSIIISAKNGTSLLFQLFIKLKPLPDKTLLKLNDILNEKYVLEQNYTSLNERINRLLSEREDVSKIESVVFSEETFEAKPRPETVAQTKDQQEELLAQLNGLKATVESLDVEAKKFIAGFKSNYSERGGQNSKTFLTRNAADGITFFGNVFINELKLSSINGHPVNELLIDSFRKNKPQKIGGKKVLKRLNIENMVFEKLGDTSACDIVFSDDPWENKNKNVINGDIILDNKLTILNDVKISKEGTKRNPTSVKIPRGTLKPVYDALNFKELEITDDFHVQKNINGQPIILPVHGGHLNILDVVNQARLEVVNVKQNLDVELINGKNYSSFMENIRRGTSQVDFESVVVDGEFSAPSIQADRLNDIDLAGVVEEADSDAGKVSDKLLTGDADAYEAGNNLKSRHNENFKRVIHVFENVEIDGILFSKRINNISWSLLNDTVKKDEGTVSLVGTKTFQKSLRAEKAILRGTFNGRFIDNVMTDFSDQILRHPQTFDNVKFKNLFVEGAWNTIHINQLNESLVKFSSNNGQESDLTFVNGCFMNILNVTNVFNNASLNGKVYRPQNGKIELKSVKAAHVIVHGSLITNNKINNMNITNFNMLRVSLKYPETVDKDIYHYNFSVPGDLNVETLNFNDMSSIINPKGDTNLIENFMNGKIHKIKKLLVKGNISTSRGINGFTLPRIFEKGMPITKPASMKGNITFENILYFNNINVTNSIDGFSLKDLEKDIAFKHSQVFLTGAKNFSLVKVTKSMRARTLNGHLVEEVMSLKGDHIVKGPIQINGDVLVRGNLTTYSAINNITVTDLLKTYSTRFNSYIYSGDLYLRNDQVTIGNLIVNGKIQNTSVDALIRDSVRKDEGAEGLLNVSGRTTFKGEVRFKENVAVEELIHGVNLSNLYSDLAFINKPTRLGGTLTIQESVLKDLETTAHFNSTFINNINTNDWLEDCIPLDRPEVVSGKKIFQEAHSLQDISVDFINGHLPSAMISLKKKQYIPTLALFPRIHSISDVTVEGFVNGKNLQNEYRDSVMVSGPQIISGRKIFDGEFVVNGTLMVDSVMGKPVNSLVTLDTEQVIKTPLKFAGLVMAKKNVENLKAVNNINLNDWSKKSVLLNREQVLNARWTVKGKVKAKNIQGQGLLYSVNLPSISKEVLKGKLTALEIKNATELDYSTQCRRVDELSQQFSQLPYLLHQFELAFEIETPSGIDSVVTFKIGRDDALIVTFEKECLSSLYIWNRDSATFDRKSQINIGAVSKWLAVYGGDKAAYLVTSSGSSVVCEEMLQRGNIWMFREGGDGYEHLLTTNGFLDITQENTTSGEFFTIDENRLLQQWTLKNGNITFRSLRKLDSEDYKFIDFRILGGLAVTNGREVEQIIVEDDKVIQRGLPFSNTRLVALPVDGKVLTALVLRDKIVVYENLLEEKIYSVIHSLKPESVLWFNYGPKKQAFLIVGSHHKLIEVYEYKSVSGLVKKMSIQMFSNRLQSVDLPVGKKYQHDKFVIVIQKKKLGFVRAKMFGDYFEKNESFC